MAQVIFLSHLPLVRIAPDHDVVMGPETWLTKLPWERYDQLTRRAFTHWQDRYERTDPVFVWFQLEVTWPEVRPGAVGPIAEAKVAATEWDELLPGIGAEPLTWFHDRVVDPVWAALALAAPAGVAAPPRSSVSFLLAAGDTHLEIGGDAVAGLRVQGDADQELVYLPEGAGAPLSDEDLAGAAGLVELAATALETPGVDAALRQLLFASDVTLGRDERTLLAVAALEGLLLPDVTTGSGDAFARRLGNLLGRDAEGKAEVATAARDLYRFRSALVHGDELSTHRFELPSEAAMQLLAGAVMILTTVIAQGSDLDTVLATLDVGHLDARPVDRLPLADPPGLYAPDRLQPRAAWSSGTWSSAGSLAPPDGTVVSWSPLVGLGGERDSLRHEGLGVVLSSMPPDQIVSMEDKDTRRDFIASLQVGNEAVAALAVSERKPAGAVVEDRHVDLLVRRRDLAVVGLRLVGVDAFTDPELLGWYIFDRNLRWRRETVLRQSVLMGIGSAPWVHLDDQDRDGLLSCWDLLSRCEQAGADDDLDRFLTVFRRVHDRRFLHVQTRASLAATCLESMLGPFGSPGSPLRLEALVAAVDGVPPESVDWFTAQGRDFRNALAHGRWTPARLGVSESRAADLDPLVHLLAVLRAVVRHLLELWAEADAPVRSRHGAGGLLLHNLRGRLDT